MNTRELLRQIDAWTKPGVVLAVDATSVNIMQRLLRDAMQYIAMQEPSNTQRVERISAAVSAYYDQRGDEPYDCASTAADLLTDLMHWCHANNVDFDTALRAAHGNYKAEA